jgi:acyl-CoA thioester hydrolase
VARHRFLLQTRTDDLDWLGHVNNVVFGAYLQEARMDLIMRWRGGLRHDSQDTVVARVEIDYREVLYHRPEPIAIDSWLERIGRTSYTFGHEVREPDHGLVYAHGRSVLVQVDRESLAPTPVDDSLRSYLARFADDGGAAVTG